MVVEKIIWDSDFFGYEIGRILENHDGSKIDLNYKLLISNATLSTEIDGYTNTFSEEKSVYLKKINAPLNTNFIIDEILDSENYHYNLQDLYELAFESGKYSRFYLDKNFGEQAFRNFYKTWIDNTINKSYADKIFIAVKDNKIVGFVSLKIVKNNATVGLISVSPIYQGHGFGKKLIYAIENYCFTNNIESISITTQSINKNACNFYENIGYNLEKNIIVKHYWKNDTI